MTKNRKIGDQQVKGQGQQKQGGKTKAKIEN